MNLKKIQSAYKNVGKINVQEVLNENESEIHTLLMNKNWRFLRSLAYQNLLEDAAEFENTNLDFFTYEKELKIGAKRG